MTTLLLANPAAGGSRAGRDLAAITDRARQVWPDLDLRVTAGPGDAREIARTASPVVDLVVVVGGDGTAHEAANGLLELAPETRPMLTVLPIGTGNDFARLLGTSRLSPREALDRLGQGERRRFDVGRAWGEYFINSLGLGFDAAVAVRVPRFRRLWRPLVYLAAVGASWRRFTPAVMTVTTAEERFTGPLYCLEVGIGVAAGGGFYLTPDARPDDGLFDVCAVRPLGTWAFATRLPTAFWGGHTRLKEVRMLRSRSVQVEGPAPMLAHFDGEVRESAAGAISIELVAAALPVLVAAGT